MAADDKIEEGTILKVTMEVRLPVAATADEISEWLESEVAGSGGIVAHNPLRSKTPEPWGFGLDWDDTGMVGREEEFDRVDLGGGRATWKVRQIVEPKKRPDLPPAGGR